MTEPKQNLETRVNDLLVLRAKITQLEEEQKATIAPLKILKDKEQQEIINEMKEAGQFSSRFQSATVSRAVRKTLQITNQDEVLKDLKARGLDKEYISPQLNDLFFGEYSKQLIKTGELLKGTAINEKEFLSIRAVDSDDRRKQTNDFVK